MGRARGAAKQTHFPWRTGAGGQHLSTPFPDLCNRGRRAASSVVLSLTQMHCVKVKIALGKARLARRTPIEACVGETGPNSARAQLPLKEGREGFSEPEREGTLCIYVRVGEAPRALRLLISLSQRRSKFSYLHGRGVVLKLGTAAKLPPSSETGHRAPPPPCLCSQGWLLGPQIQAQLGRAWQKIYV